MVLLTILRPGFITKEDIIALIGSCNIAPGVLEKLSNNEKVESPGMLYRHYAPKTNCILVYNENLATLKEIIKRNMIDKTIIIGSNKLKDISCYKFINYGETLPEISHNIFSLLRLADTYQGNLIIIEGVKKEGLGLAIMNRLIRTSSFNYIDK